MPLTSPAGATLAALALLALLERGDQSPRAPAQDDRALCTQRTGGDRDGDGLPDECEAGLAAAFAPVLLADPADCLWDPEARGGARLRGGYLYAVAPWGGGARVAYLPAYFRDCGWTSAARARRLGRGNAHDGDSELVVVEVRPRPDGGPEVTGVFLSAHCGGRAGGRCRWFRGAELDAFHWAGDPRRSAPRVWVASDKHAHYASLRECERGHWREERCAAGGVAFTFPVVSQAQNIGSRARPAGRGEGCLVAEALPLGTAGASAGTLECLWSERAPFRGWQPRREGEPPTPYGRALRAHAGL